MWTYSHVLKALNLVADTQGTIFEQKPIEGFSFHTPTLKAGQAFLALRGQTQDGHHYLADAWSKSASLLIAQKDGASHIPEDAPHIFVPCTYEALNQLGSFARRQANETRVVAITGSVGKTTTKEWVNQLLSSVGPTVASIASYNNHTGVPLSLTDLIVRPDYGVFEVGMNHVGEIAPLAKLIQPHACIVTTIGSAHIGNMGSLEETAKEKATIQQGLLPGGVAILPFDSPFYATLKQPGIQTLSFGTQQGADVRLVSYHERDGKAHIEVDVLGRRSSYILPFIGQHYAHNILAVLALAEHWNLKDLPLHTLTLAPQRGEIYTCTLNTGVNICVMDDSYNANPTSMKAGLSVFQNLPSTGRRIAIIGEMFELGAFSAEGHINLAEPLHAAKVDHLYAVGEGCLPLIEKWDGASTYAAKASDIVEELTQNLRNGDILFIKGSNSSGVRHIMTWLRTCNAA